MEALIGMFIGLAIIGAIAGGYALAWLTWKAWH